MIYINIYEFRGGGHDWDKYSPPYIFCLLHKKNEKSTGA